MRSRVTLPVLLLALVLVFATGISCDGEKSSSVTNTPQVTMHLRPRPLPQPLLRATSACSTSRTRPTSAPSLNASAAKWIRRRSCTRTLQATASTKQSCPVSSGGTQGNFGFIVMGYLDGKLKALLSEAPAEGEVRVAVTNSQLVETLPVYESGDQPQFPSKVKNIYYAWDGSQFVVDHEETVPNPNPPPHA